MPVLPEAVPGAAVSPGMRIWSFVKAPALIVVAGLVFGGAIVAASLAPTLPVFLLLVAVVGGGQIIFMATCNTLIQLRSDAQMRGRVMSVYLMTVLGSTPIGGPIVGAIAESFGARYAVAIGGVAALGAGVYGLLAVRKANAATLATGGAEAPLERAMVRQAS